MTFTTRTLFTLLLATSSLTLAAHAQDKKPDIPAQEEKPATSHVDFRTYEAQLHTTDCSKMPNRTTMIDCAHAHEQVKVINLVNSSGQNDANEILVAVRNVFDPSTKIYLLAGQNAIVVSTYPEEFAKIEAFVHDLDRPKKAYRLTYTITESDAGKRIGTQHFSMMVVNGQRATLKQGSKIPVITGSYSPGGSDSKTGPGVQTQYTYLDVGMNFDATLNEVANGAILKSKVELSSIADQKAAVNEAEPIVRQTVTENVLFVPTGKPVILGSVDIGGSTRHVDIDVMMEPIP